LTEKASASDKERTITEAQFQKMMEELKRRFTQQQRLKGQILHQQFTIAVGTIGAIAFAALVLVLQDRAPFEQAATGLFGPISADEEFRLLLGGLGIVSILSAFSVISTSFVGAGMTHFDSLLGWAGYGEGIGSIFGFSIAVQWIVSDLSGRGGTILIILIFALSVLTVVGLIRGVMKASSKEGDEVVEETIEKVFGS